MSKTLRVSPELKLPLEAVTETFGLLAVRGAGKTNAARVMAEEMFEAGLHFVAVDPVGSWWGLRAGREKGAGIPIPIFGGRRGDVPLEKGGGGLLADLVVDQRISCVLDLSTFESEGAKKTFLLEFARRLYQRNEAPLHLFLEEADDYIPQRPMREEAQLLRAWENIVRRGRARGLGMTLITQRSASLNKNVLTQVQTLIAMRTTGPQDRAAIEEWLKYHAQSREILESLPSLGAGEAWVWSPQFLEKTVRIRFRLSRTLDSGETPKVGKGGRAPATLADVDLGEIQRRMAATIEKAKAEDPRALRARVAELERELKKRTSAPAAKVERVEIPVLKDAQLKRLEAVSERFLKAASEASDVGRAIAGAVRNGHAKPAPAKLSSTRRESQREDRASRRTNPEGHEKISPTVDGELTGPEQRILDALAWLDGLGIEEAEQPAVAFLAGYTIGGGAWNNPRGRLHTRGLVDYRSGRLALTEIGRVLARAPDSPLTTEELHRHVLERLPGPEGRILQVLLQAYPDKVENDELARAAGYEPGGGAYNNPRGRLRSLGLIEYPERGWAVARDLLFLEAPGGKP